MKKFQKRARQKQLEHELYQGIPDEDRDKLPKVLLQDDGRVRFSYPSGWPAVMGWYEALERIEIERASYYYFKNKKTKGVVI